MVVAKATNMPLTLWGVVVHTTLLRKNLKINSLCGYPRARNLRATPNRLLNSHHSLRLLLNRIPSVIKLM